MSGGQDGKVVTQMQDKESQSKTLHSRASRLQVTNNQMDDFDHFWDYNKHSYHVITPKRTYGRGVDMNSTSTEAAIASITEW
jgi:hypothetical protein